MAMQKSEENFESDQQSRGAENQPTQQPEQSVKRLEFRRWDEAWTRLAREINENRRARGLPEATDAEISIEIQARRAPEKLEALQQAIRKGINSLDSVNDNRVTSSARS
jgi:cell division protein FtsX